MSTEAVRRVPADRLRALGIEILARHGLSREHAEIMEANLLAADLRGVKTHGHWMLERYCSAMRAGRLNPRPEISILRDTGAAIVVDGDGAPGHLAGHVTMQEVIQRARQHGTALGLTRRSNHFGAAAYFAVLALEHDMIGFAATNAGPTMFPVGGRSRVLGNNPIAYAIPAGQERPVVLDMAMTVSAMARVGIAQRLGQRVPEGWIVDKHGRPTTDPEHYFDGGAGVPISGPKGVGLAQVTDALAGVLAGGPFAAQVDRPRPGDPPGATGHVLQAIDVGAFMPVHEFKARMDEQIRMLHKATRVEGVERIYVAGEMEWEHMDDARANGVPLLEVLIGDLNALAESVDLTERL